MTRFFNWTDVDISIYHPYSMIILLPLFIIRTLYWTWFRVSWSSLYWKSLFTYTFAIEFFFISSKSQRRSCIEFASKIYSHSNSRYY